MGTCLDQVKDTADAQQEDNDEFREDAGADLSRPAAGNSTLCDYFKSSSSIEIPEVDLVENPSDSPSNGDAEGKANESAKPAEGEKSSDKVAKHLSERVEKLRTEKTAEEKQSWAERSVQDGKVKSKDPSVDVKSPEFKAAFAKAVQERLANELEAKLRLNTRDGILAAVDRLRAAGGDALPEDFDEKVANWIEFQKRQRIGNEEAAQQGLTDDEGNPLRFPCEKSDEDLAGAINALAETYENFEQGKLTGEAAEAYNGHPGAFYRDMESIVDFCLDPIEEDDQASIGSCAMNTQLVAMWTKSPLAMAEATRDTMTQGWADVVGGRIELSANELGRTREETNGQPQSVFIGNSMIASAAYGRMHYNGNVIETMDEAAEFITGYSVSSMDGAYHKVSPGHSMGAMNVLAANGDAYRRQYNHWKAFGKGNEPGDGNDKDWGHINVPNIQIG